MTIICNYAMEKIQSLLQTQQIVLMLQARILMVLGISLFRWPLLTKKLQEMFIQTFSKEAMLHNEKKFSMERDWQRALLQYRAHFVKCPVCGRETLYRGEPICSCCHRSTLFTDILSSVFRSIQSSNYKKWRNLSGIYWWFCSCKRTI